MVYTLRFFPLQNAVCFKILTNFVPVLFSFYIFIQQIYILNIFNMVYTPRFSSSSKCSLFQNSNVFDSFIILILFIYSTNIGTVYFKHGIYSPFFFSSKCSLFHNYNLFGSCIILILFIYSTNIGTEYFKNGVYSPFFSLFKMQFVS